MAKAKPAPATEPLLTCPYTGEALVVTFCDATHGSYCAGGFDPLEPHRDLGVLLSKMRMRNGRTRSGPITCPYLGTPINAVFDEKQGRCIVSGNVFSPRTRFDDKYELLHAISFRDGVAPAFPAHGPKITVRDREQVSDPTAGVGGGAGAEEFIEAVLGGSTHA
jgi:hypothetical protein